MATTIPAKLVTIFASPELRGRLERDLSGLGSTGYSISKVDGRGQQGSRTQGMFDSGNIRIEALVSPEVADSILTHLSKNPETNNLVAFSQSVDAMPRHGFA